MKKYACLIIFFAILLPFSALHAQEYMKKKKGKYKKNYSNGQLETTGMIENHFRVGEWKTYSFKGELQAVHTYSAGILNGPFTLYYYNGVKSQEGAYTNNIKTGELINWYGNGKKKSVQHFNAEGNEIGLQQYWALNGVPTETIFYKEDGTKYITSYYPDGAIAAKKQFLNQKPEGPQYYYSKTNGKNPIDTFPKKIETFHNGLKEGVSKRFGKNNVLLAEYYHKNDLLDSVGREWNENGTLKFEFHYKENQLHGYCINYEDGKKHVEGNYKNGKLEGKHIQYAPELCYTWYSNDEMDSCRCYHENKKLRLYYTTVDPVTHSLKGIEYDTLGKKAKDWILLDNLTEGPSNYYYPNGKIKSTFESHKGYPTGTINAWSPGRKLVLRIPLDQGANSSAIEAWSDAGVKLEKGTVPFVAQVKKYLPPDFYFNVEDGFVYSEWEEAPPMEVLMEESPPPEVVEDDKIYSFAETMPEFPDFYNYLKENIIYPEKEKKARKEGTVYVSFVVEKDGSVTKVQALKSPKDTPGFDAEAVRVIGTMPNWKPGTMQGRPVRVQIIQPVKFLLGG
jgi:TonB family protein